MCMVLWNSSYNLTSLINCSIIHCHIILPPYFFKEYSFTAAKVTIILGS